MSRKGKFYLAGHKYLTKAKEGDKIVYEMPPFCSGDYSAIVKKDKNGLYIDGEDHWFDGCRDFEIVKKPNNANKTNANLGRRVSRPTRKQKRSHN